MKTAKRKLSVLGTVVVLAGAALDLHEQFKDQGGWAADAFLLVVFVLLLFIVFLELSKKAEIQ